MSSEKFDLDLIKTIPIDEVIEALGGRKFIKSNSVMHCCNISAHKSGDRNPSMGINRSKNTCRCFSCAMGGSSIDVVMSMLELEFKEACKWLYANFQQYTGELEESDVSFYANKRPFIPVIKESAVYGTPHFDNSIKDVKKVVLNDYIHLYDEQLKDYQKVKFIYTFIYRFSLIQDNAKVVSYYNNRGIVDKKIEEIGFLDRYSIEKLENLLRKKFPLNDLIRFKVFNDKGHFKYRSFVGFGVVPMFDLNTDMITGLTLRDVTPNKKKFKEMQLVAQDFLVAYPYDLSRALRSSKNYIFLTEGHIDGLSLGDEPFISFTGVYNYNKKILKLIKTAGKKVIIAFDNDEAGRAGAERLQEFLNELDISNKILQWDAHLGNDLNDLLRNKKLDEVLKNK